MIWTLLVGLVVGAVAKFVLPGKDPGGIFVTMLLGVGGALLASWLGANLGFYQPGEPVGFIGAVVGSVVILLLYRTLTRRRNIS